MNIKPLGDRVLIKREDKDEKTEGGIILPESAKEKPNKGTIVAMGPGGEGIAMEVSVGDTVLYNKHAGEPLKIENDDYLMMKQSDIIAVV